MTAPTQMNVIRIRGGAGNYEWATICWTGWRATGNDGTPRECGEILIHSSFGSWANQWGHLGIAFDEWLQDAECDYCAGKFMGSAAYKFDGEKSVRHLRQSLLEHRKAGDITKNDARTIWSWIEDNKLSLESSEHEFVQVLSDCAGSAVWQDARKGKPSWDTGPGLGACHFLAEPWDRPATSLDRSFAGFWRDLWPVFVEHLKARPASQVDGGAT